MIINPKKSLGQNFLIDKNIIKKISNLINLQNKVVLEIGLVQEIYPLAYLKINQKSFLQSKKIRIILHLKKQFNNKITIINQDILKFDENSLSKDKLIVFGNLPTIFLRNFK